jgi:hypothetical protein
MNTPRPTNTNSEGGGYGSQLVKFNPPALSSTSAAPAPVSKLTGGDVIQANMAAAARQNNIVGAGSGRAVAGGSKRKRRSHNKNKRRSRSRSHKRHRNKRGGNTPTRPTTTVPQFGALHAGANKASVNLNGGAMLQTAQAQYDNPNQPPVSFRFT